jgi:rhodanese-related sulfurtransferase
MTNISLEITELTDLLLLDLREPEEYEQYHIREAINFEGSMISRDKMLPIMLGYKN